MLSAPPYTPSRGTHVIGSAVLFPSCRQLRRTLPIMMLPLALPHLHVSCRWLCHTFPRVSLTSALQPFYLGFSFSVLAFEHSFMATLVILMLGGPWLRRTACIPFEMFSFTASF